MGWANAPCAIAVEQSVNEIAPGRVESDGHSHSPLRADYVLMHGARRIAVVEAKRYGEALGGGRKNALVTLATGTGKTMIAMPDDGGAKARWRKTFP